ncbi:MAG TPA: hypothetical protein VGF97_19145 [Rhizomicrobium sp.]|jgi:hypothetical protein
MFRIFPMLLISVVIYNLLALGHGLASHDAMPAFLAQHVTFHMFSGDNWDISLGDALIMLSLIFLFVEVVKATRTTKRELLNHGLSMLTFVAALVEFIAVKGFSTSTFFLILFMCVFDVVAGYTISIVAAEHDLGLGRAGTD